MSACVGGYSQPPFIVNGARERCTAREYAGYQPWLPTTAAGMLAYLEKTIGVFHKPKLNHGQNFAENMINSGFYLLMNYDLTPAQQAAMYHALAQIPGLTIVPRVTDLLGRAGVGIRSHSAPGEPGRPSSTPPPSNRSARS